MEQRRSVEWHRLVGNSRNSAYAYISAVHALTVSTHSLPTST
jgi:hypothetical protein